MPSIGTINSLFGSQWSAATDGTYATSTNLVMDADNKRIAIAFFVTQTMSISDVDLNLAVTGTLTGINFRIRIESDGGSVPSGTVLGATGNAITPSFTVSATGFQGLKTLSQPTGDIAPNTLIWIVLYRQDGNSLSGSNSIASRGPNAFQAASALIFNGTSYTGGFSPSRSGHILRSTAGELFGNPWAANFSTFTTIIGSTVAGIKYRATSKNVIRGVAFNLQRNSSPGNVTVNVYQNSTLKRSVSVSGPVNFVTKEAYFDPVEIDAHSDVYITLANPAGSGNYVTFGAHYDTTYKNAIFSNDTAYVYGTSTDPTALSVSNSYWMRMMVYYGAPDTDFSCNRGCSNVFLFKNV